MSLLSLKFKRNPLYFLFVKFAYFVFFFTLYLSSHRAYSIFLEEHVRELMGTPEEKKESEDLPWFTGPLLTPSAHTIPPGYGNFEPYLFVTETRGQYNRHKKIVSQPKSVSVTPLIPLQFGLTKFLDISLYPQFSYTNNMGRSSVELGDLPIILGFQILRDTEKNSLPALKLQFRETFPTGKYQKGSAHKNRTDLVGAGSFATNFGIGLSRLLHFTGEHWLNSRIFLGYTYSAPVHVKGLNSYGGAHNTRGKVYPGNSFLGLIGFEATLARHWALALDIANSYVNKTRFRGHKGLTSTGTPATVGGPSSNQWSVAPALEYNFNECLGVIGGVWFSVGGRNASTFTSGVIAVNYFTSVGKKKHHGNSVASNIDNKQISSWEKTKTFLER